MGHWSRFGACPTYPPRPGNNPEVPRGLYVEWVGIRDALGMRGTYGKAFILRATVMPDQILATPFADVAAQAILPVTLRL